MKKMIVFLGYFSFLMGNQNVYVGSLAGTSTQLTVIDGATQSIKATIPMPSSTFQIYVSPDGKYCYTSSGSTSTSLYKINVSTNQIVSTLTLSSPGSTNNVYFVPTRDENKIYARPAGSGSALVFVIDPVSFTILHTITVPVSGRYMSISPDGTKLYTCNTASNNVSVIDTNTDTILTTISASNSPYCVAFKPDGTKAYIMSINTLTIVDTTTYQILAQYAIPLASGSGFPFFTPDGSKLYITSGGTSVYVIDPISDAITQTIPGFTVSDWIAFTPDSSKAFISDNSANNVKVLNLADNSTIATISGIPGADAMAISPDGQRVYVSANSGPYVKVIDASTYFVISTVTTTATPIFMAFVPVNPQPIGGRVQTNFLTQTDYINTVAWNGYLPDCSSSAPFLARYQPVTYNIFYNPIFTQYAGSAPATGGILGSSAIFYNHNRPTNQTYNYSIQAVDMWGSRTNTGMNLTLNP